MSHVFIRYVLNCQNYFQRFVRIGVAEDEGIIEIETEDDGSLSVCNIAAQFPNVSGLKYFNTNTKFWRGVRFILANHFFISLANHFFHQKPKKDGEIPFMSWY